MKHIIVIETADGVDGLTPHPMSAFEQEVLTRTIDLFLETEKRVGFVQCRFNVSSAIAAVHEMYGAPVWDPNYIPSQGPEPACEWYGRNVGPHSWVDTVDGHQRCQNCKYERPK